MFRNKWNLKLDKKYRLTLPVEIPKVKKLVYLKLGKDDCVNIPLNSADIVKLHNEPEAAFPARIERKKNGRRFLKRVLIPEELRGSVSFYFFPKVTLVMYDDLLLIWPGWVPVV